MTSEGLGEKLKELRTQLSDMDNYLRLNSRLEEFANKEDLIVLSGIKSRLGPLSKAYRKAVSSYEAAYEAESEKEKTMAGFSESTKEKIRMSDGSKLRSFYNMIKNGAFAAALYPFSRKLSQLFMNNARLYASSIRNIAYTQRMQIEAQNTRGEYNLEQTEAELAQYLMKRGLNEDTADFVAENPQVLDYVKLLMLRDKYHID